jgi:hypothetical protein
MVYALHKFKHYLLYNMFTFYIDHTTLIYLINKPQVSSRLIRWVLLFLKYDFKIIYKPNTRSHLMGTKLNLLEYLINLVILTCSQYNLNGYKMFMSNC